MTQTTQQQTTNQHAPQTSLPTTSALHHILHKPALATTATDHTKQGRFRAQVVRFKNPWLRIHDRKIDKLRALWQQKSASWHADKTPIVKTNSDIFSNHNNNLDDWSFCFIGHATVLIKIGNYHFLTDPVWATRASPVNFAGPKRIRPAAIALEDLPKIDAILLSHNHYDHLDLAALEWLHNRDNPMIYTGLGNASYLPKQYQVVELDWWQQIPFALNEQLTIIYTPAQHFSGRGLRDRNCALWGGVSILTPKDHLFFAGDTGYAPHFKEIYERLGAPRLALLPIGAYQPRALFKHMHMNPLDAVQAHLDLHAKQSLAIHYRTFQLTFEAMNQPLLDLASALQQLQVSDQNFLAVLEGIVLEV